MGVLFHLIFALFDLICLVELPKHFNPGQAHVKLCKFILKRAV